MAWIGAITNAGAQLMANWTSGSVINLDKAVAGTGTVEDIAILAQTGLADERQEAAIISSKTDSNGQRIRVQIGAADEGYLMNQIGMYASLDGGEPVLIALFQNPQGVVIPSADESPDFLYVFNATLEVSNQVVFQVTVDSSAYVSQGTMEEYVAGQMIVHTDNRQNPHGVTKAQVGLSNVNNTSDVDKPVSTAQAAAIAEAKKAGTDAQTTANGKAPTSHASSATTYGAGSGTNYGHVKLSDATDSTSGTSGGVAATPAAVKSAYDLANTAKESADGKLPLSGGTLTGNLTGKYITGTWLQTTEVKEYTIPVTRIAVMTPDGWIYYRTVREVSKDIGSVDSTSYTTLMARGTSLHSADTDPTVNGTICWTYK